jgi:hypothetical protein
MEIDETMEAIGDKQSQMMEVVRQEVGRAEQAMQSQVQALGGRLSQVDAKITDARSAAAAAIETLRLEVAGNIEVEARRVAELTSQVEEKLQKLDGSVDKLVEKTVSSMLTERDAKGKEEVNTAVEAARSSLGAQIATVESQTNQRISGLEKKYTADTRRLQAQVDSNRDFLKGSVELRVANVQREMNEYTRELSEKLREMDDSLEGRVETVIEKKTFSGRARGVAVGVFTAVRQGVGAGLTGAKRAAMKVGRVVGRIGKSNKSSGNLVRAGNEGASLEEGREGSDEVENEEVDDFVLEDIGAINRLSSTTTPSSTSYTKGGSAVATGSSSTSGSSISGGGRWPGDPLADRIQIRAIGTSTVVRKE